MKILFISHSSVIFNYREKLRLLAQHKDIDLTLLLPKAWHEAGKRVLTADKPKSEEGIRIISAPVFFEGRIKRHYYPHFSNYVAEVNPDLIHIEEEPYSLVAWQAARAARKFGIPLVFFTWENLFEHFPFPHQSIRREVLRTTAHAIAGDIEARKLLEKSGYSASRISVIPQYGVNPKLFRKKKPLTLRKKLKLKDFTVGYVGRLVPEKGLQNLLVAFSMLNNKKADLLVVGGGPLRGELEAKSIELGISHQVHWVSSLDQSAIPDYLNCMDTLVLPSVTTNLWKEQFGRVLIEAMACEVPVVGSDSGAIPEVIGKAGLIFPEGNVPQLAGRLRQLEISIALRKKLGPMGRKRVLGHYTNQTIADKIYRIYRKLGPALKEVI
jgi:glycosyltransferase involved in cell wall biosynthesis